jgi:hypothetical protein
MIDAEKAFGLGVEFAEEYTMLPPADGGANTWEAGNTWDSGNTWE